MRQSSIYGRIGLVFLFSFFALGVLSPARADVDIQGDVQPSNPNDWGITVESYIGDTATGSVEINGGSSLASHRCYVGNTSGATGTFTITGENSLFTIDNNFSIGYYGTGTLNITGGGAINNTSASMIGFRIGSSGSAIVDGDGSIWSNNTIYIGSHGNGTLDITNQGLVEAYDTYIGLGSVLHNILTVDGAGSTLRGNRLFVGYAGSGTLHVLNGATAHSNNTFGDSNLGYKSSGNGTVTIDGLGSTWINENSLFVGNEGDGLLTIQNGGLVTVGEILTIDNNNRGNSFINMSDGGVLAIAGDVDDSLTSFLGLVQGTDTIRWWDPAVADWNLLTTATAGTDYTLAYINDGGDLDGYTLLTVTAIEPPAGDANFDGQVDASDATILAGNWQAGPGASWLMGDFNGDGYVNASDATILAGNWQAGTGATSVPEPTSILLLVMLGLAVGCWGTFIKRATK
ncbi:MAG: dockerin type I domain-containing protein [Planctomycetia bacterium]|jgi:T5SS/PEP-CTERM-associated repeat protein